MSSSDSEIESDIEPDPNDNKRILRYLNKHDKEFKDKLYVFTMMAKSLAKDHARSIRRLRKACMESAAGSQTYSQAPLPPKALKPTVEEPVRVAAHEGEEATESPVVNETSEQLAITTNLQDMAHAAPAVPSQTTLQHSTSDLPPSSNLGQIDDPSRLEGPNMTEHRKFDLDDIDDDNASSYSTDEGDFDKDIIHEESPTRDETSRASVADRRPAVAQQQAETQHQHESGLDDVDDDNASSYSTDEGDFAKDITHEESPTRDETSRTSVAEPRLAVTPQQAEAQTRQEPVAQRRKSSQLLNEVSRRWKEEEEDFMIEIIHDLMQREDPGLTKSNMWQRASEILKTRGYDRTGPQMMAKWSFGTRYKCEARGLDWASTVMAKLPHMARKRNASSGNAREGELHSTPDGQSTAKRTRIRSRKVVNSQTPTSNGPSSLDNSHLYGSQPRPNGKTKTQKPKRQSRSGTALQSVLPHQEGFNTKVDSTPTTSGNHLRLRAIWARTSSGMVQVDWSQDSKYFVAASSSVMDPLTNLRDNRPMNLVHGSLPSKTIRELPEHRVAGNVHAGEPKYVYQTVSAVRFAPTGHMIYSAGFDNKVRVWDAENEASIQVRTEIQYSQKVEVMDVAREQSSLFATGTANGIRSIRVFLAESDLDGRPLEIRPLRETGRKSFPFSPTCLRFGHLQSRDWLIAGFGTDSNDPRFGAGCTTVWKFHQASCEEVFFHTGDRFVFDCAWSSSGEHFVIASASDPLSRANTAEHSVVQLYSSNQPDSIARYGCRAKDINDVTINYGLVTASCTDGSTYVWDQRQPQKPLHRLAHGRPSLWLARGADREIEDVGVRYIEWSHIPGRLYTGSSDGILKYWDTRRSPADVLVEDLADTGCEIMCGRLSPDHSSLLLGDEEGCLHLLSTSNGPIPEQWFQFQVRER
ncbi:uncharacterized protein Z519_06700 [Cladophialophora bantiana CBS 173.52]|uniref:Myb-like domain-containing protein n=1 Tax=Cladophialophora bantiana (strain ATCC 10958 / CBS 173.52 / CDC B-1940 / NIH 8579) TaxID=1442370 RepID=A0A0D2ESJ7_CLAB1|nr:uncharacterized protein Z519_06700 [Cladophialophora bantiana CBS 173.52]KIW92851.1 hypothetical protein Z519_06700 [Cladophialophora bantiana CBS 173.52]